MLAVVGHQGREDIYAMRIPEFVNWVIHTTSVYCWIKGVDPVPDD